jgi:hypothetical protein
MKTLLIAFAILLATGGGLAVMNNACKTSLHAWCAPKSSHVSAGPSARTWPVNRTAFR